MIITYLILGVIIGSCLIYLILRPQIKQVKELNTEIAEKNQQLRLESVRLTEEQNYLFDRKKEMLLDLANIKDQLNQSTIQNEELKNSLLELTTEYTVLTTKKEEILLNIAEIQKQAEESSVALYEKSYELANEKMSQAAETLSNKYQQLEEQAKKEYYTTLQDCSIDFVEQIENKKLELQKINAQLDELTSKLTSAVEAAKRAEELRTQQDFYKLQLSQADIDEITRLREVIPYLRDSEPLNKVIWKVYYEKAYTDLIGRVIGTGTHTGIYKITNIQNQMCYVGQAADLASRWRQHIKRGMGAETPTRNKLYPAMAEFGVENFTFEIIEECSRTDLNEREDFWQEYFHAKDFGYSIK